MNGERSWRVVHNEAASRFEALVEGQLCAARYQRHDGVMRIFHTGVPRALRGHGIAAELVRAALEHARAQRLRVQSDCSYVDWYMRRHPETLELLQR